LGGIYFSARRLAFTQSVKGLWLWILIPWLIDLVVLFAGWIYGLGGVKALTLWAVGKLSVSGWLFDLLYYPAVVILVLCFWYCGCSPSLRWRPWWPRPLTHYLPNAD